MSDPSMLPAIQDLLAQARERSTIEFKSNWDQAEDIGEYISALANAAALDGHERAWMIWGVDDVTRQVKGTTFDPFHQKVKSDKGKGNQSLVMWLQFLTQPRADFQFHELQHPEGRVVLLEIHPARSAPVAFKQVRYIRIDSHKVRLAEHPDKEARLWALLGLKDDWTGELVPGATFD
ncbi:MAG: ATP-binding protein, partial [Proteobacteria bacterium]|nr:ATP-binding protein [Pseudomonadota bacterium]